LCRHIFWIALLINAPPCSPQQMCTAPYLRSLQVLLLSQSDFYSVFLVQTMIPVVPSPLPGFMVPRMSAWQSCTCQFPSKNDLSVFLALSTVFSLLTFSPAYHSFHRNSATLCLLTLKMFDSPFFFEGVLCSINQPPPMFGWFTFALSFACLA